LDSKGEYERLSTEEKQAREKRQAARAIKAKQNAEKHTKACGCNIMGGKTKRKRNKNTKRKRTNTRRNRKRR